VIWLLWALLWVLLGLIVLVVAALAFPVRVSFEAATDPARLRVGLRVVARWMPEAIVVDTARPKKPAKKQAKKQRVEADETPEKPPKTSWMSGERRWRMIHAVPALLRSILRVIRIEDATGALRFGLGDPAETGQVYGYLVPITVAARGRVTLTPDFNHACFVGQGRVVFCVVPLRLLPPLVRFGWASFGRVS
jgi:hypothetical protein